MMIVQLEEAVLNLVADTALDKVSYAKVATRNGEMIIQMGIEMIMEMVFKRGAMIGCAISVVRSVDGMRTILLYFMPLGSVILALLPCLLTMIIGNFQGILLVLQLELEKLREADWALKPNTVRIFMKLYRVIRERQLMQHFTNSSLNSPRCWII